MSHIERSEHLAELRARPSASIQWAEVARKVARKGLTWGFILGFLVGLAWCWPGLR